jgi:hypothetical protein
VFKEAPARVPGVPNQATRGPWQPRDVVIEADTLRPQGSSPKSGKAAATIVPGHRDRSADKCGPAGVGENHYAANNNKNRK